MKTGRDDLFERVPREPDALGDFFRGIYNLYELMPEDSEILGRDDAIEELYLSRDFYQLFDLMAKRLSALKADAYGSTVSVPSRIFCDRGVRPRSFFVLRTGCAG